MTEVASSDNSWDQRVHKWPSESPYGAWGEQLGLTAWRTMQDLIEETEPQQEGADREWVAADYGSFNGCFAVLFRTHTLAHLKPSLEPRDERQWMENLEGFHINLPFSESERIWVLVFNSSIAPFQFARGDEDELVDAVASDEIALSSSGVEVTRSGQDLVDSWWDWRRQVGQFEHQRSVDEVRLALEGMVNILTPRLQEARTT